MFGMILIAEPSYCDSLGAGGAVPFPDAFVRTDAVPGAFADERVFVVLESRVSHEWRWKA